MNKTIYFAGGCFWGVQAFFKLIDGVISTEVGYINGTTSFPSYEQVKSGKSGHAEAVKVIYDDNQVSLEELLDKFLSIIDPYSEDKQGNDVGHQYRTGIYYVDPLDGVSASVYLATHLKEGFKTEISMMRNFYPAEEEHQDYLDKHPDGYCHINLDLYKKK